MALDLPPLPQWVKDCVERYKRVSEDLKRWLIKAVAAIAIISNPAGGKPIFDRFSRIGLAPGARSFAVARLKGTSEYHQKFHGGYHSSRTCGGMLRIPFPRLLQLVRDVAASRVKVHRRVLNQAEEVVRLRGAVARHYSGSLDLGVIEKNKTHRKAIEVYSEVLNILRG